MTEQLQNALTEALQSLGSEALGPEVWEAIEAPDNLDLSDSKAVTEAARALTQEHPRLFRQRDWTVLSEKDFEQQENDFLERLRQPPKPAPLEFKNLDAALLSPEQETALRKYLGGRASKFEMSILKAAKAEQERRFGGNAA